MILGHINDLESAFGWLPEPLKTAVEHLKQTDFSNAPEGRYDLRGNDIFVLIMDVTTKPVNAARAEVHRQYVDVQFLCTGREKMGVASDTANNAVSEDALDQRDVLFYADMENESTLTMVPGSFAVFFPSDVHRPGCAVDQPERVRKVVVKIRASLLQGSA